MQYCRYTLLYDKIITSYVTPSPPTKWHEPRQLGWLTSLMSIGWARLVGPQHRREGRREKHPSADTQNRYSGKYFVQRKEFLSRICFCFLSSCFSCKFPFPPVFILPGVKIYRNWPKHYDVGGLGGASSPCFTNHDLVRYTAADWVIN